MIKLKKTRTGLSLLYLTFSSSKFIYMCSQINQHLLLAGEVRKMMRDHFLGADIMSKRGLCGAQKLTVCISLSFTI